MTTKTVSGGRDATVAFLLRLGLVLLVIAVYWPVYNFRFVNLDDPVYIYRTPAVTAGVTLQGVLWALTSSYYDFWHPLTWWSHMLDCQLFGLDAGPQHLVNLAFHIANTLLVFSLLRRMTGAMWRSAAVAALFGIHPLHVESVAWLSERKDVLSTLFWLLTLRAYVHYAQEPSAGGSRRRWFYGLALVCFALALMAKAMVVTLPFVLVLLDFWPLDRIRDGVSGLLRSLKEKIPFFLLTLASCIITYVGMLGTHNIHSAEKVSWPLRLTNIPVSYVRYLFKMAWPADLAVLYPLPARWEVWQWGGAVLLLLLITGFVLWLGRKAPYLAVGWFYFLGTLVPTIGLVVMGRQAIADRYTYIPSIGLTAAIVWGLWHLLGRRRWGAAFGGIALLVALAVLAIACHAQVKCWRDSTALWQQCLAVTRDNAYAHQSLARHLFEQGDTQAAREHGLEALRIEPDNPDANAFMGGFLARQGRLSESTNYLIRAMDLAPRSFVARVSLATAYFRLGEYEAALPHFTDVVRRSPKDAQALALTGRTLTKLGRSDEAIDCFQRALKADANCVDAHFYLGLQRLELGEYDLAETSFSDVMRLAPARPGSREGLEIASGRRMLSREPDSADLCNNLAWLLAASPSDEVRNGPEAVRLAEHACQLTSYQTTVFVGTLAAAYAEAGQFEKAVSTAQKACDLAAAAGETNLLVRNQALLEQYKNGKPCRDSN